MTIVDSRIDTVKVYHSGATIYRVAELSLTGEDLPRELEIQELPLALFDPSVRVRVEHVEPEGTEILATDVRVGLHAITLEQAREDPDREALKEVRRKIHKTSLLLEQVEMENAFLRRMEVPSRAEGEEGKPPPASPMAARVALEQLADDAIQQRIKEGRSLRLELRKLGEQASELEDQIRRASTAKEAKPHELRKTVIARLSHTGEPLKSARLIIEYFVPGVCWAPAYQCRLTRDCQQAEIQLRALVCQRSGEDWRGVKLMLSTASPMTWTELPELTSIRIGRAQPALPVKRGYRPPPRGAVALFADYDRDRTQSANRLPPAPHWNPPGLTTSAPSLIPDAELLEDARHAASGEAYDDFSAEVAYAADERESLDGRTPTYGLQAAEPLVGGKTLETELSELAGGSAPPPQPQAPPPMPSAPAMASPGPPRAARAPAPKSRMKGAKRRRRDAMLRAEEVEFEVPTQSREAADALVFAQLRLHPPDNAAQRCRLVPVDSGAAYLEILNRADLRVHVDLLQLIARAQQESAEVSSQPLPEGTTDVRYSAGYFDYSYEADSPVDLESDGTFHSLALGTRSAKTDVRYTVVPREETSVYRMATLTNPLPTPLLPGPVEVHVGGDYVLTTGLPKVAPSGEFQLGLGVEQAIKVARNTKFSESRSGTKVVAMTELRHTIDVELVNNLDRGILCEVRERIPYPAEDAEVVVEENEVTPPWEAYDQHERRSKVLGGRRWQVKIAARETKKLHAGYAVKIYANNELVGGNRREA
jgi:hypothetical protein